MINRLVPSLVAAASGAIPARASKHSGIPDFGALLEAQPVVEGVQSGPDGRNPRKHAAQSGTREPGLPTTTPRVDADIATQLPSVRDTLLPCLQPAVRPFPAVRILVGSGQGQAAELVEPGMRPSLLPLIAVQVSLCPAPAPSLHAGLLDSAPPRLAVQLPLSPQMPTVDPVLRPVPAPQVIVTSAGAAEMPAQDASLSQIGIVVPVRADPTQTNRIGDHADAGSGWASEVTAAHAARKVDHVDTGTIGERIELVSMPWRLQANAGLSYRTVQITVQGEGADVREETAALSASTSSAHAQLFPFAFGVEGTSVQDWVDLLQPLAGGSERDRSSADITPTTQVTDSVPVDTMASLVWPERLLRWLADADGKGTTAWLRDYQIDPSQAMQMIDSLRSVAEQQGLHLQRVMFNGHELWHSAPTPDITSRG